MIIDHGLHSHLHSGPVVFFFVQPPQVSYLNLHDHMTVLYLTTSEYHTHPYPPHVHVLPSHVWLHSGPLVPCATQPPKSLWLLFHDHMTVVYLTTVEYHTHPHPPHDHTPHSDVNSGSSVSAALPQRTLRLLQRNRCIVWCSTQCVRGLDILKSHLFVRKFFNYNVVKLFWIQVPFRTSTVTYCPTVFRVRVYMSSSSSSRMFWSCVR